MAKERTPEQIEADKARMAKVRAAKVKGEAKPEEHPAPQPETISQSEVTELLKRIEELEKRGYQPQTMPQVTTRGVVGTIEKYPVNPALYPDPREKLASEAKLQRFAFKENYDMDWNVSISSYETVDGVRTKEPKFTLQLNRIIFDDDGEKTDGRYVVGRMIMHEDPDSALTVARQYGLEVPDNAALDFLNEMRYLQMRDWLIDAFIPPSTTTHQEKKDMVVEGQVVEFFTVNSEKSAKIPFGELNSKLGA